MIESNELPAIAMTYYERDGHIEQCPFPGCSGPIQVFYQILNGEKAEGKIFGARDWKKHLQGCPLMLWAKAHKACFN